MRDFIEKPVRKNPAAVQAGRQPKRAGAQTRIRQHEANDKERGKPRHEQQRIGELGKGMRDGIETRSPGHDGGCMRWGFQEMHNRVKR